MSNEDMGADTEYEDDAPNIDADDHAGGDSNEFTPPDNGSWVPRDRFNRVNAQVRDLQAKVEALSASQAPPKEKEVISRATLLAAVDSGQITQERADEIWEEQITDKVTKQVTATVNNQSIEDKHAATLAEYEDLIPELSDTDSDLFNELRDHYRHMVTHLGLPDTPGTMVAATEAVVGKLGNLKRKAKATKATAPNPEGGSGSGGGGKKPKKDVLDNLNSKQKAYYEQAITKGVYRDWKAVRAELEYDRTKAA